MEQDSSDLRWKGKVSAMVKNTNVEEAWPIVKDFFNLHKRFPTLATCYGIHGTNGEPGCIRYCAGSSIHSNASISWSKEKLILVDDVNRILKYEIVDCNIGFNNYESTITVLKVDGLDGCIMEWCFAVDPVQGLVLQDLVEKYHLGLQRMAHKIEEEVASLVRGM